MGSAEQIYLFNENKFSHNKIQYKDILTVSKNKKGVLDVDTVKGCTIGMIAYPHGAYYCSEAETEIFLKECGLSIYNRIVYLESEFTRLAHAKKTLNMRKFPKREQKIIVGYKGKISNIKENFMPMGRL